MRIISFEASKDLNTAEEKVREMEEKYPSSELVTDIFNIFSSKTEEIERGIDLLSCERRI